LNRLRSLFTLQSVALRASSIRAKLTSAGYPDASDLAIVSQTLARILTENIVPFWYPSTIDTTYGGYRTGHDSRGQGTGLENKYLVNQARLVWFYSRLAQSPYGEPEHIDAARHGYHFLRDYLWDTQYGGFFWEVEPDGRTPVQPAKHMYGQAFALYSLSEYAVTARDSSALSLARQAFAMMDERAHDGIYGGYREFFDRDWNIASTSRGNPLGRHIGPDVKTMNTHLHLLEAVTKYCMVATDDALAQQRLIELISISSNAVVRKRIGACTDQHMRDWTPLRGPRFDRVSYGHNLEAIWLLSEACTAAKLPLAPLLDLYETFFDYAFRYGFDRRMGGFFEEGPFKGRADRRGKVWWVQAESLLCALQLYRLTRRQMYYECFQKTLVWIADRQVDWRDGEWFDRVENGKVEGIKAGAWKDPYHNARAMMECLVLLADVAGI
jgi:cellobiose epimerase